MELTPQHRQALIERLEKAQEELSLQKELLNKSTSLSAHWHEIGEYLSLSRINAIKEALITNQIDY